MKLFIAKIPSWMKSTFTDRIVGGKTATGPIPWQVSMQRRKEGFFPQHFCGGTILDANTVLSAAQCFTNRDGVPQPFNNKFVVAGAHDLQKATSEQVRSYYHFLYHFDLFLPNNLK